MNILQNRQKLFLNFSFLLLAAILYHFYIYPAFIYVEIVNPLLKYLSPEVITTIFVAIILAGLLIINSGLLKRKFIQELFAKVFTQRNLIYFLFIFTIFFSMFSYLGYKNLMTHTYDFGLQLQVIWNTAYGRWFEHSIETTNYLGDHFSLLMIFPALLYRIIPHVLTVFLIQTACVTFSAYGIYRFFLFKSKNENLSVIIAITYCLHWGVGVFLVNNLHFEVLAMPLLVWGSYFVLTRTKTRFGVMLLLLSMLGKEDVGLYAGSLGLYMAAFEKRKLGIFLAACGFGFSLLTISVLIPLFRSGPSDTLLRYGIWGDSAFEIIINIIAHPLQVLTHLLNPMHLHYYVKLFFPLLFIAFFAPKQLLITVPLILVNALANYEAQITLLNQYELTILPAIFIATAYAYKNMLQIKHLKLFIYALPFLLIFFNLALFGGHSFVKTLTNFDKEAYTDAQTLEQIKSRIPETAVVMASNTVGPWFAEREYLLDFFPLRRFLEIKPDFIIVDKKRDALELEQRTIEEELSLDRELKVDFENETYVVLVRQAQLEQKP